MTDSPQRRVGDERWLREHALPIVRSVAGAVARGGGWAADYDDLVQEGLLAVWREGVTDPKLVAVCARRRMIDAQRRSYGRSGSVKHAGHWAERSLDTRVGERGDLPLHDRVGVDDDGFEWVEAEMMIALAERARESGLLAPREREVLVRQSKGETLRAIGESWGVTEGRACQVSMAARRKVAAAMRGGDGL